jgi:hypothetical protein
MASMTETREAEPFPLAVRLLVLTTVLVSAFALFTSLAQPRDMDFISFWAAGKLALAGQPLAAYDLAAHKQVQLSLGPFTGLMPFPYPPPFLLLATPLALLPFGVSAIAWVVGTFALYIAAARRVSPSGGWLAAAFPPVLVNGMIGQNGLLTGAIFIAGMRLLEQRPVRAGLLLGCLIIKPQLAVLLPLAFAAGGHWRAVMGAAASSLGLLGAALVVFGADSYVAFAGMLPLFGTIASDGLSGWHKMASVYASMRLAGATAAIAWSAHILVGCAAMAAVWTVWRSKAELAAKTAVLAAASMLISPYIYLYDTVLLLLPFLWLLRQGEDPRHLAVLWCIPLVVVLQNWGFNQLLNPAPLLPVALLVLVARRLRQSSDADPALAKTGTSLRTPYPPLTAPSL